MVTSAEAREHFHEVVCVFSERARVVRFSSREKRAVDSAHRRGHRSDRIEKSRKESKVLGVRLATTSDKCDGIERIVGGTRRGCALAIIFVPCCTHHCNLRSCYPDF